MAKIKTIRVDKIPDRQREALILALRKLNEGSYTIKKFHSVFDKKCDMLNKKGYNIYSYDSRRAYRRY